MLRPLLHGAIVLLGLAIADCGTAWAQNANPPGNVALHDISVVPMDSERVLEHQTVIIRDGVIAVVGDAGSTEIPADLVRIEGAGQFLMPGLADLHVHLRRQDELVSYLNWGVTTIMHLGGSGQSGQALLEYRRRVLAGTLPGPRIYTTERIFDGDPPLPRNARSLTTPEAARQAVRELQAGGYDFIKIYNNVSQPVFDAIVAEARRAELAVIGHIPRSFDALLSLRGGQNAIAHTEELFFTYFDGPRDESTMARDYRPDFGKLPTLIEVLSEHQVALMPDLSFTFTNMLMWDNLDTVWNDPEFAYLHPETALNWQRGNINRRSAVENFMVREQWKYTLMQTLTVEFDKAGLLQVIGTDSSLPGLFPGKAVHRELTELVKAGLSNFNALSAGTRDAGVFIQRFIDADAKLGQVRPGFRADLVVLAGNPLEDVRQARNVLGVFVEGRYHDKSVLEAQRTAYRQHYAHLNDMNERIDRALQSGSPDANLASIVIAADGDAELLEMLESRINAAGYAAASAGMLAQARNILAINTRLFPESANVWDSLAEITLYGGDAETALGFYQRAIAIDPDFRSAAEGIARILQDRND